MGKFNIISSFSALFILLVCFQGINARSNLKRSIKSGRFTHKTRDSRCPAAPLIVPCVCDAEAIYCQEENGPISQETINHVLQEFRQLYNVTIDQPLQIEQVLLISSASMTSLDLTPLLNTRLEGLAIIDSPQLTRIHGPGSGSGLASIDIGELYIAETNLNDEGLSDFFPYFTSRLYDVDIESNNIKGPSLTNNNATEFFRGIGDFNVAYFYLEGNKIEILGGGSPFQKMGFTRLLGLANNGMREVREGALFVDDSTADLQNTRTIYMEENNLNDESFHVNHGLDRFRGRTILGLENNQFTFISAEKFEPFLKANSENSISLYGNPLVCDERMYWVNAYPNQVAGVDC